MMMISTFRGSFGGIFAPISEMRDVFNDTYRLITVIHY